LLDEPTAGMSPEETDETMRLIRELAVGRTVILVEHKMKVVMKISDRITVLHQGQVLAEGTPEEIQTYYGEAHILQGVSLHLDEGEVVTLIGRNGAGKTTTLRSIMGIARPSRGRVTLGGADITRLPTHEIARRGIAWIPEERRILPNLTVLENLRLGMLGRTGGAAPGVLDEVFDYFPRLRERVDQRGILLSGGEQQMLAIARGLVARPSVMLVDEPTEGLA